MAVEELRGCGYRKVGGTYLCGEFTSSPCDRMPFPLTTCPVCGQGIKVGRAFTKINPHQLWGIHKDCKDYIRPCFLCDPQDEPAYIMLVGAGNYKTPQEFVREAIAQGISKRIPFIPKELKLGKTVVYLAHPKACEMRESAVLQQAMAIVEEAKTKRPRLLESEKVSKAPGIFCAFSPKRVEKLVWENELTDEKREQFEKRGITPVLIPNGDKDHA
ncbi:hypothetical protein ES703_63414 [subsurface metagenome]